MTLQELYQNIGGDYDQAIRVLRVEKLIDKHIRKYPAGGVAAAKAIRALPREDAARIPIIALTANAFEEDVNRSMEAGMNAHLTKPIEPKLLYGTMARLMK